MKRKLTICLMTLALTMGLVACSCGGDDESEADRANNACLEHEGVREAGRYVIVCNDGVAIEW